MDRKSKYQWFLFLIVVYLFSLSAAWFVQWLINLSHHYFCNYRFSHLQHHSVPETTTPKTELMFQEAVMFDNKCIYNWNMFFVFSETKVAINYSCDEVVVQYSVSDDRCYPPLTDTCCCTSDVNSPSVCVFSAVCSFCHQGLCSLKSFQWNIQFCFNNTKINLMNKNSSSPKVILLIP